LTGNFYRNLLVVKISEVVVLREIIMLLILKTKTLMKKQLPNLVTIIFFTIVPSAALSAQNYTELWARENRAVIVVTGLKITSEAGGNERVDLSVAEGAAVTLSEKNGRSWTKNTEAFSKPFGTGGTVYTADFPVVMDSVYSISITFKTGTVINVDNYRLPRSWKTHHYFHSTDGTKSPASVLRKETDKDSGLSCYVYSLYPLSNYRLSGGTQVK
jgi:hypothetical protein